MLRKLFPKPKPEDHNSKPDKRKIGWSQRFFIFAGVMFLLGWATTGIMSNAKNLFDFSSRRNLSQQRQPKNIQIDSNMLEDASINSSDTSNVGSMDIKEKSVENSFLSQVESSNEASPIPPTPVFDYDAQSQVVDPVNWGDWFCANCLAVPARVKLTHYWPPLGGDNCWTFYDDYCYSPTKSTIPWETVIEISAACPVPWLGSVVEIPALQRRFLCLDTGDKVVCKDGTCVIDVLTDKIYAWDGMEFDAIIYYPQVWVEPAPTFTPVATPNQ